MSQAGIPMFQQLLNEGYRMTNTARNGEVLFVEARAKEVDGVLQVVPVLVSKDKNGVIKDIALDQSDEDAIWEIVKN